MGIGIAPLEPIDALRPVIKQYPDLVFQARLLLEACPLLGSFRTWRDMRLESAMSTKAVGRGPDQLAAPEPRRSPMIRALVRKTMSQKPVVTPKLQFSKRWWVRCRSFVE